jgi:CheY-like chemotaxis protein
VTGRQRTIFLIDADEESRITHETILRGEGYELMTAVDANAALSQVREQPPDLLLIGSKIGRMPPIQLIRLVNQDSTLAGVRICMYGPAPLKQDAEVAGADCFLVTPVSPWELLREIVSLIGRA